MALVAACTEKLNGNEYDENTIRHRLNNLDSDSEILFKKEVFDQTNEVIPENVGNQLSCLS